MSLPLASVTDQRHALRVSIERASEQILDELWKWEDERIRRVYGNLHAGRLVLDWTLEHPDDVEPSGV